MEPQNFGHSHELVFNEEVISNESRGNCSRCGELVSSGPCFSCGECKFWVHKQCAEAPSELNHPFHGDHSLILLPKPPYRAGKGFCDFCKESCELFVYHCSCELDLHIKCAFFTLNIIAEKKGLELHLANKDPSIQSQVDDDVGNKELENAHCFGCREPLLEAVYLSVDCGFKLHKKCADLPHQINHPLHTNHPLVLQFDAGRFSCHICRQTRRRGFIYCCSACKFALHIKCAELPSQINHLCHRRHPLVLESDKFLPCMACSRQNRDNELVYCCNCCIFRFHTECAFPPSVVKDRNHPHSFILFLKDDPFICDACGTSGNCVAYLCPTCMLIVHKKCISLPHTIELVWHRHPIIHNYCLPQFNLNVCLFCNNEVNTDYGCYYCSICSEVYHVDCALKNQTWYDVIDGSQNKDIEKPAVPDPFIVIETISDDGEAIKIRHFSHDHDLVLSHRMLLKEDDKLCNGCVRFISSSSSTSASSFYFCPQCDDFFLHEACAQLPMEKRFMFHDCRQPHVLINSEGVFKCQSCEYDCSGFSYRCSGCNHRECLRCQTPRPFTIEGHKHPLLFYRYYKGKCNACGSGTEFAAFRCKRCDFVLHFQCAILPVKVRHKCDDEHLLALTYHDANDYPESHVCEVCEKERDPNLWFYYCAICDNSLHIKCALGKYPFIKPGTIYKAEAAADHPHPFTFVENFYTEPECLKCGRPCRDTLALECAESACNYTVHWECVKPRTRECIIL